MRLVQAGAMIMALVAAGCVSYNSSDDIVPIAPDLAKTARIGAIIVRNVPANVTAAFRPALERALRTRMDACAAGNVELTLEVAVGEVKIRDVGRAILLGDSNIVKGQARLLQNGQVVGDYDISHSVGGGNALAGGGVGLLTAVSMGDEEDLADSFAVEICHRAFPRQRSRRR
jgi:hypothetical protein